MLESFVIRGFVCFELDWMAIEQPFRFPVETAKLIEQINEKGDIRIHSHPEPELVVKRSRDQSALYFEAKAIRSLEVASLQSSTGE
jgi:hypothetical protein